MLDPFHLEAYDAKAVNYNRDVETFPVLKRILEKIGGAAASYRSPTDMGVNRAGFGIVDDAAVRAAACQEIIRRYFRYSCEYLMGFVGKDTLQRVELLMNELGIKPEDRAVVEPARRAAAEAEAAQNGKGNAGVFCGAALALPDGTIVTGKNSPQMHATSSLVLNAIKMRAGIPDGIHLLSPQIIGHINHLKGKVLGERSVSLNLDETLIALSISAATNPTAQAAMEKLTDLAGCDLHSTHMPTPGDEDGLRKLGVNITSDPQFASRNLFVM